MHVKFSQARAEADAISPLSRQIGKDTERLPQQWASRLIIAARTALEVHRSTALNRTHLIHVEFEYELGHAEWADRFFFHSAKVVTFAEAGDTYASEFDKEGTELWRDRLEFARAQVNSAEGKTIFYTTFYTRYTLDSNSRCDTSLFPCIVGSGDLTPGDEAWFANPPHPDWEGLLRRYSVGSAPDIDAMFADDVAESNAADGARRKE